MARQNFNPDNTMLYQEKDGTIPETYTNLVLKDVVDNSKVMQLGKAITMNGLEEKFQFFAKGPGAYWVDEGQKIQTSKAEWKTITMRAHKLGVILPVSREFLTYKMADFFTFIAPRVAEAFYKKFDNAVILGVESPYTQNLLKSAKDAGQTIQGELNYENILGLEDFLTDEDMTPNAFITTQRNRSTLRKNARLIENGSAVDLYDKGRDTIDGLTTVNLRTPEMKKGNLILGDFDYLYYGIPYGISYSISTDATLSTIKNEDGSDVNLFEQELMAARFTMDIGAMIVKDQAFAAITPAEGAPEA